MGKTKTLALGAATAAVLSMTGIGAADAGTVSGPYGTLTANNASAGPDECVNETQYLTGAEAPDNADVTITGPGGVSEFATFDASGYGTSLLCSDADPAGVYSEHVALYDADYDYLGALDTTFTFTHRAAPAPAPAVKRTLKIKRTKTTHKGKKAWKVVGTARSAGAAWAHRKVRVQAHYHGLWIDIPGTKKKTNAKGKVTYTVVPKKANHFALRLDIAETASTPDVHSKIFRAPKR